MILSHKIRLNPTPEQEVYFQKAAGVARFAYNWGLAEWKVQHEAGLKPAAHILAKQFNAIKREMFPFVLEVTKYAAQRAFTDLGIAFDNFFRGLRDKSVKIGYPKFKSKRKSVSSFYLGNDLFSVSGNWARVSKLGMVNMAEKLRLVGKVMNGRVTKRGNHWYVSIQVEVERPAAKSNGGEPVGIDLGVKTLMTLSDGGVVENQNHTRKNQVRLRKLNRKLSRQVKGSNNWWKTVRKLRSHHEKIANQRRDYLHKHTTHITKTYAAICLEDLNVAGMVKNRNLAKSISDASFGEIARQLSYKSLLYGSKVLFVSRFFPSSKTCHCCGWKNANLSLNDRRFVCQECGVIEDRDVNAALNIKKEALRLAFNQISVGNGYTNVTPVDALAL